MKILIIRNSETAPEGAFGEWLARQGHILTVVSGEAVSAEQMADAELVVMFGSPRGVYQTDIPWIAAQRPMVAARLAAHKPTIGICFGAQMMAVAAGGEVGRMADGRFFRGWYGIDTAENPILGGLWPRWHGDTITPPPGAEVIARDAGTVQAFRLPNAIAVQFHPEATPAIMRNWASLSPPGSVDIAALDADSAQNFAARTQAREALFASLLDQALGGQSG